MPIRRHVVEYVFGHVLAHDHAARNDAVRKATRDPARAVCRPGLVHQPVRRVVVRRARDVIARITHPPRAGPAEIAVVRPAVAPNHLSLGEAVKLVLFYDHPLCAEATLEGKKRKREMEAALASKTSTSSHPQRHKTVVLRTLSSDPTSACRTTP